MRIIRGVIGGGLLDEGREGKEEGRGGPKGSTGFDRGDALKGAGPGRHLGGAAEDGMAKGLLLIPT